MSTRSRRRALIPLPRILGQLWMRSMIQASPGAIQGTGATIAPMLLRTAFANGVYRHPRSSSPARSPRAGVSDEGSDRFTRGRDTNNLTVRHPGSSAGLRQLIEPNTSRGDRPVRARGRRERLHQTVYGGVLGDHCSSAETLQSGVALPGPMGASEAPGSAASSWRS
jgi:hypothetical protein